LHNSNKKIIDQAKSTRIDLTEGPILNTLLKLATAAVETAVVAIWLQRELANVQSRFAIHNQSADLALS
jgi:hypothetical protein